MRNINSRKSSLLVGSIIIFLIVVTPYLLYFYKALPSSENIETIFGTIKGGYYESASNYIYWFSTKFVPLLLLFIWFITNKHWWVHALIIPITVYSFQLISVINDSEGFVDEVEFVYTVPITIIIVGILYFLRGKLSIYIQALNLKEVEDKINALEKKKD